MNMRILDAVRKLPYADPVKNMYFDDMRGFVCFIPSVIVGEPLTVMYSNTISVRHKSTGTADDHVQQHYLCQTQIHCSVKLQYRL